MKISLLGYMGAGKSALGEQLATQLQWPFYDLDALIEIQEGRSVNELMAQKGELYFRKVEHSMLQSVLEKPNFVLSLGGGTPCYYNNMELVNAHTDSFYLRASPSVLAQRLANTQSQRPLLAHLANEELPEFIAKHLFERAAFYESAKHILQAQLPLESLIEQIIHKTKES